MFQFLIYLFLIVSAQKYDDKALLKDLKITLDECSDIAEAVGDFLSVFETKKTRRRASDLGKMVVKRLKTCADILGTVTSFRNKHFPPLKRGLIELRLHEVRFLSDILKNANAKVGKTLYVATRDGVGHDEFHKRCDNQGPTILIVQSTNGAVFGAYTDVTWGGNKYWTYSKKTFLFRLRPVMAKYNVKSGQEKYAVYLATTYCPTFGRGFDLHITCGGFTSKSSSTKGGNTYNFPTNPNHALSDGSHHFVFKDWVVMKALTL